MRAPPAGVWRGGAPDRTGPCSPSARTACKVDGDGRRRGARRGGGGAGAPELSDNLGYTDADGGFEIVGRVD